MQLPHSASLPLISAMRMPRNVNMVRVLGKSNMGSLPSGVNLHRWYWPGGHCFLQAPCQSTKFSLGTFIQFNHSLALMSLVLCPAEILHSVHTWRSSVHRSVKGLQDLSVVLVESQLSDQLTIIIYIFTIILPTIFCFHLTYCFFLLTDDWEAT